MRLNGGFLLLVSKDRVTEVLKTVLDPELALNIVDLGLVYEILVEGPKGDGIVVKMTLTTPACPMGPELVDEVKAKLSKLPGVKKVGVEIVWDPPWTPEKMSEQAKIELGLV